MIYEVRTYTLRPGTVGEFESRFEKRHPYREKHSKLGAFWHSDIGPLNQVIHVWEYDDLFSGILVAKNSSSSSSPRS